MKVSQPELAAMPSTIPTGYSQRPTRVVIAEDDTASRELLHHLLEKWGFNVCVASDGLAAWEILQAEDVPTIALLDWMMPGLEGVEVCRRVRALPRKHYTYILLLTAKTDARNLKEGLISGADDYIRKPYDAGELQARLVVATRIIGVQKELSDAQEMRALANQAANSGAFDWDIAANINRWPPETEKVYGIAAGKFDGTYEAWAALVLPEDLAKATAAVEESLRTGELVGEFRIRRSDNHEVRWIGARAKVFFSPAGKPVRMIGINLDITNQKRAEAALANSEQRYRNLVENSTALICTHDLEGKILSINPAAARSLGLTVKGCIGKNIKSQLVPEARPNFNAYLEQIQKHGAASGHLPLMDRRGKRLVWSYTNRLIHDEGSAPYVLGHAQDITEQIIMQKELRASQEAALAVEKRLARVDGLTGLANRRAFYEGAELERKRSLRYSRPLSIAYIDLDNFKAVNDEQGHEAGDQLLASVGKLLRENVRAEDIVGRLGGDEFAVLLPENNYDNAVKAIAKIHGVLNATAKKNAWNIGFSVGMITYNIPPETVEEMIHAADQLMYSVKHGGKNRFATSAVLNAPQPETQPMPPPNQETPATRPLKTGRRTWTH